MRCGLLGEKLGHSYSPQIHAELGDYEYLLYEKAPDEVENFVRRGDWHGLNVTIPYKKTVIPFCDELSETARAIGSVNTLLRRSDGSIFGDNTDACGFEALMDAAHFAPKGKKALVLGTGGASATVCAVLRQRGANVITVSRTGEDNYESLLPRHDDMMAVAVVQKLVGVEIPRILRQERQVLFFCSRARRLRYRADEREILAHSLITLSSMR